MDVLPSEEEQMLKNLAREFLEAECPPSLARAMEKDELGYPPDLWKKMAELGWFGLALPEQYGGQGMPLTYLAIIMEEAGRAIAPVPFHCTMAAALTIAEHGTDEQKREALPVVSRGDMIFTWALTETDPRSRPQGVRLEAREEGDYLVLSGTKMFVDSFSVADKCVVVCRTAEESPENEGLTVVLVDAGSSGISYKPLVTLAKDRQCRVTFDNVRVPKANVLGDINRGWPIAEWMLDRATALLCAQMVGATRKDAEMAIEYSKNRVAFGRPIGSFQSIQHLCADMTVWVDGAQLLTYEALWKLDQGLPATVEVSQAKSFCNEKCEAAVRTSQTIHGGIGFMMEFDLHLWYRRVSAWTMRLGTSFEHRERVARALLDQPGQVRLGMPLTPVS